jgi:hypothetical protein
MEGKKNDKGSRQFHLPIQVRRNIILNRTFTVPFRIGFFDVVEFIDENENGFDDGDTIISILKLTGKNNWSK